MDLGSAAVALLQYPYGIANELRAHRQCVDPILSLLDICRSTQLPGLGIRARKGGKGNPGTWVNVTGKKRCESRCWVVEPSRAVC